MNDIQKEPVRANLNDEKRTMEKLEEIYSQAGKDIAEKIRFHDAKISVLLRDIEKLDEEQLSLLQAQIYQREFQKQLKRQIDDIMKNINDEQYDSIDEFMKKSYENGFIGTLYDIQSQGVPLIFPIDQQEVLDAALMNSKISKKLYKHLGKDVNFLKRRIASDVARGIATSLSYSDIARNIERVSRIGFNRAMRIARTEGHNMRMQGIERAQRKAKEKGADIVKQWDATLDGRTRDSHAAVDGEIRELDEPFSNGMMRPGDSNASAAEVVNCRCVLLQRAQWALGLDELKTLQERAEFFGLDKAKNFEEYRRKYLKIVENTFGSDIIKERHISDRMMSNGLRTSPYHILVEEEIKRLVEESRDLDIPLDVLIFNEGGQTGFSDRYNKIFVRGDVLPDMSSNNLRDTLSSKAVLAHEYYGHFKNHPSQFSVGDWRDEFRASYRAALDSPNLSDIERMTLMLDAYDRAKEAGIKVKYNKEARRLIYGYYE